MQEGGLSVMVIIIGNGIGDPGSNPRQSCLHFILYYTLEKGMNVCVFLPAMGK